MNELVHRRPLTEREQQLLAYRPEAPAWRDLLGAPAFFGFVTAGFAFVALAIASRVLQLHATRGSLLALAAAAGGVAATWTAVEFARTSRTGKRRDAARARDVAAGVAEVTRYEVVEALQVEEYEDEGEGFFLGLRDGRVLFLDGWLTADLEQAQQFPSTALEVSRALSTRLVLDVTPCGTYLPPSATLPPFPLDRLRRGEVPANGAVLDLDLGSIRRGDAFGNTTRG